MIAKSTNALYTFVRADFIIPGIKAAVIGDDPMLAYSHALTSNASHLTRWRRNPAGRIAGTGRIEIVRDPFS